MIDNYHSSNVKDGFNVSQRDESGALINLLPSPISNIPNELLVAIFANVNTVKGQWEHMYTLSPSILISHVCRLWRSIALDTSELWAIICLKIPDPASYKHARLYASRSRDRPLQVYIWQFPGTSTLLEHREFLTNLIPRMSVFEVKGDSMRDVGNLLGMVNEAPLLQRLQYWTDWNNHDHPDPYAPPIVDLPALRELKIKHGCTVCAPRLVNLVFLHITNLPADALPIAIRDCPALTTLVLPRFTPVGLAGSSAMEQPVIEARSIKRMALQLLPRIADFSFMVARYSLPNLEYLEIFDDFPNDTEPRTLFPAMKGAPGYPNPFPRVHTLHLQHGYGFRNCMAFLQSITTVRHVVLTDNADSLNISKLKEVWPDLQTVHINLDESSAYEADELSVDAVHLPMDIEMAELATMVQRQALSHVTVPDHPLIPDNPLFRRAPCADYGLIAADDAEEPYELSDYDSEYDVDFFMDEQPFDDEEDFSDEYWENDDVQYAGPM